MTNRPEKVLGLHYFNPAVLMKLVEVIRGDNTSDETLQIGYDFVVKNNKIPVKVQKERTYAISYCPTGKNEK